MVVTLDIEWKSAFNVYGKDLIKCSASSRTSSISSFRDALHS